MTESALLEIYRYVPPSLLERFDPEMIDDFGELLDYLAKARFIQQLEQDIVRPGDLRGLLPGLTRAARSFLRTASKL